MDDRRCVLRGGQAARAAGARRRKSYSLLALVLGGAISCGEVGNSPPAVRAASLNLLHGLFCPADTGRCRLEDRVDLFYEFVRERGCPEIVTLQEGTRPTRDLLRAQLATVCPQPYQLVIGDIETQLDDEIVLTSLPVLAVEQLRLYVNFRKVLLARLQHQTGPVDVFSTHLASGSDGAGRPCGADCPAECVAAGATNVRQCQSVQVANWVAARHEGPNPALVLGDFNDPPGSFVYRQFVGRGWPDAYLAAGNPECEPSSGLGCTSGRQDENLSSLESPVNGETERIDFAFVVPAGPGAGCAGRIVPPHGAGDLLGTRLFADQSNPFAPICGPLPEAICWPSDHIGVQVELGCG